MKSKATKGPSAKEPSYRTKARKAKRILRKQIRIPNDDYLKPYRFKASYAKQKGVGHNDVLIEFGLAITKDMNNALRPINTIIEDYQSQEKRLEKILNESGINAEVHRITLVNESEYLEGLIKPTLKLQGFKSKKKEVEGEKKRIKAHLEANAHTEENPSITLLVIIWGLIIGGTYFDAEAMYNFLFDSLRLSDAFAKGGALFTSLVLLATGHLVSVSYYHFRNNIFAKWSGAMLLMIILGVIAYFRITLGTSKTDIYLAFLMAATTGLVVLSGFITHKGSEYRKEKWRLFRKNIRFRYVENRIKYYKLKLEQLETDFENKCKLEARKSLADSSLDLKPIREVLGLAQLRKDQITQGYTDLKNKGTAQIKSINPNP